MLKKFRNEFVVDFFYFRVDVVLWCMQIKMMIYGGILENFVFLDDMWEYSLVDFIWRQEKLLVEFYREGIIFFSIFYSGGRSGVVVWVGYNEQFYLFVGNS